MNLNLKIVIGIQVGMVFGGLAVWTGTYSNTSNADADNRPFLESQMTRLVRYANTPIQAHSFSCNNVLLTGLKPTVGNVLAAMTSSNMASIRNRQSFECIDNTCSLSITDCKPWQNGECGSRFLTYEIDKKQRIKPKSFNCIDVP
jgi:hypothetical protein